MEVDYKEYAKQLRENAVKNENGIVLCSSELWEEIASIIEQTGTKIKITPYDTPWEIACMIINAKYEAETLLTKEKCYRSFFDIEDLKRIGEHLVNYCNAEMKVNQ